MNECGLGLSDSPLVGEPSQEGRRAGDRGAIFYNLYNWSLDMSDLTLCVCVCVLADEGPFTPIVYKYRSRLSNQLGLGKQEAVEGEQKEGKRSREKHTISGQGDRGSAQR